MKRVFFKQLCLILAIATLSRAAIATTSRAASADATPFFDRQCSLPTEMRTERLARVERHIKAMDAAIVSSREIFMDYDSILRTTNKFYGFSRASMTVATIAGMTSGIAGFYGAFVLGEASTLFGVVHLSLSASRAYMGASQIFSLYNLPKQLKYLAQGDIKVSREQTLQHERFVRQLGSEPWFSEAAVRFMSSDSCRAGECSWLQPKLELTWKQANALYQKDLAKMQKKDRWWKPDALSHLFGRTVAEVHLPWNSAMIEILMMKKAYAESVRFAMLHDRKACAPH
jgi:hypothetical protein